MEMKLPSAFTQNIRAAFGGRGREWLSRLPDLIEEASTRWGLENVRAVSNLSYNFVAYANRPERNDAQSKDGAILKIGVPNLELTSEMQALKFFGGEDACRLLDCDEEKGFLLIERLQPGKMLAELEDDDERAHIAMEAARVFSELK